ncbi:hypothetical protein ACFL27_09740 [candidate division CSSED10-310 bacterium]|uniref:Archaeal glycosylation protein B peripheral domain-containing protein n=1 Tax=candidate division CSSED10-310 bacterium TaxID=2855610 RepID=A0ABV6YW80_UNCC1
MAGEKDELELTLPHSGIPEPAGKTMNSERIEKRKWPVLLTLLVLYGLFLLSLLIRLGRYEDAVFRGKIQFLGADTYYHMRRIHLAVMNWPQLIQFDSYLDYPQGAGVVNAPGYDFLTATLAFLAAGGRYNPEIVDLVGSLLPPLLGASTIFIVYWVTCLLFEAEAGYWAASLHCILFGGIWVALFGKPDHHVIESLLVPLLFGFLLKHVVVCRLQEKAHRIRIVISLALLLTLCQLMWRGAIMFHVLFLTSCYLIIVFCSPDVSDAAQVRGNKLWDIGMSLILTSLFVVPWSSSSYFGGQGFIVYYALSLFHPLFYLCFGLVFLMSSLFILKWHLFTKNKLLKTGLIGVATLAVVITALTTMYTNLLSVFLEGLYYIAKTDTWMQTMEETKPLFSFYPNKPFRAVLVYFGYWFFIFLGGLIVILFKRRSPAGIFFLVWSLSNLVLATNQIRYTHLLVTTVVILAGHFLMTARKYVQEKLRSVQKKGTFRIPSLIFALVIWTLFSLPSLENLKGYLTTRWERENALPLPLFETLLWLRNNTPVPGSFTDPGEKPAYGVMSIWDYGNWILYLSQRPVVASNFGFLHQGLWKSCGFLLTTSWPEMKTLLEQNQIRYILLGNHTHRYPELLAIVTSNEKIRVSLPSPFEIPISEQLYRFDGAFEKLWTGKKVFSGQLRLIYESAINSRITTGIYPDNFKVFEYVKGACLELHGESGQHYSLSTVIITNQGRKFYYKQSGNLHENGQKTIYIPYSHDTSDLTISATEPYALVLGNNYYAFTVTEDQVIQGTKLKPSFSTSEGTSPLFNAAQK